VLQQQSKALPTERPDFGTGIRSSVQGFNTGHTEGGLIPGFGCSLPSPKPARPRSAAPVDKGGLEEVALLCGACGLNGFRPLNILPPSNHPIYGSPGLVDQNQKRRSRRLETRTAAMPMPTSVNDQGSGVGDTPVTANALKPPISGDDT
jgi:hypothetical protein